MFNVGDAVEITKSIHADLVGKKYKIAKVNKPLVGKPYYQLDRIAGLWTGDKLKKV